MQDETELSKENNPYHSYDGLFCKVILKNFREGRPIKGKVTVISEDLLRIKGTFLDTTVNVNEILLITTKLSGDDK